jgi:hypothetical protein
MALQEGPGAVMSWHGESKGIHPELGVVCLSSQMGRWTDLFSHSSVVPWSMFASILKWSVLILMSIEILTMLSFPGCYDSRRRIEASRVFRHAPNEATAKELQAAKLADWKEIALYEAVLAGFLGLSFVAYLRVEKLHPDSWKLTFRSTGPGAAGSACGNGGGGGSCSQPVSFDVGHETCVSNTHVHSHYRVHRPGPWKGQRAQVGDKMRESRPQTGSIFAQIPMSHGPMNSAAWQGAADIILSFLTMVTVAPVVAVATLVWWNPERWGGSVNPLSIIAMAVFGLLTTPLWPTYIPAVAVTPFVMHWVARLRFFSSWPLAVVLGISFVLGAIAGFGVISIIVPWDETADLILNWVAAGGISGGVTLTMISFIFRLNLQGPNQLA